MQEQLAIPGIAAEGMPLDRQDTLERVPVKLPHLNIGAQDTGYWQHVFPTRRYQDGSGDAGAARRTIAERHYPRGGDRGRQSRLVRFEERAEGARSESGGAVRPG